MLQVQIRTVTIMSLLLEIFSGHSFTKFQHFIETDRQTDKLTEHPSHANRVSVIINETTSNN